MMEPTSQAGRRGREHQGRTSLCVLTPGTRNPGSSPRTPAEVSVSPTARHTGHVRITVWVRPGSARPGVGGERGGALVVRVSARAVDGQATAAALAAVASAFGVRRRDVTLVAGTTSRTKVLDVDGADPAALSRLLADADP
jgi:uncharacterized protein YggU (UPF0235/DUF167 family)